MPSNFRKPPSSLPDNDGPPPIPSRPGVIRQSNSAASKTPTQPSRSSKQDNGPPPLPNRGGRGNRQPVVELEQEDLYEEMNSTPPAAIVSLPLRSHVAASSPSYHDKGFKPKPTEDKQDMYEVPSTLDFDQTNQNSVQQRMDRSSIDAGDSDSWSDWSDDESSVMKPKEDPVEDLVYELPHQEEVLDDLYCQADPDSPAVEEPSSQKWNNNSEAQMKMINNNGFQPRAPFAEDKPRDTPASNHDTPKVNEAPTLLKKMLEQKVQFNKPLPPPKPGKINLLPSSTTTSPLTSPVALEKGMRKDSRSEDNTNAGSVSAESGGPWSNVLSKVKQRSLSTEAAPPKAPPQAPPKKVFPPPQAEKVESGMAPPPPSKPAKVPEPEEESQELYADACSLSEDLSLYDWFHGTVDRKEGERRIQSVGKVGTFLLRTSKSKTNTIERNEYPYTLVIKTEKEIKNMRIRHRQDQNYAIGTSKKPDEIHFPSLVDLVQHHRENDIKIIRPDIQRDEVIKLLYSPKKC